MPMFDPPHPGLIIQEVMGDRSITELAKHLKVTRAALSRVINGNAGVSPDMAMRLQDAFGVSAAQWLRLQAARDLWLLSRKKRPKVGRWKLDKAA